MKRSKREAKDVDVRFAEPEVRRADSGPEATRSHEKAHEVEHPEKRSKLLWPEGVPRPTMFQRRRPAVPCKKCDRVLTDLGSRAVVCNRGVSEASGKAYLTCRVCGHEFDMPLQR